MEVWLCYSKVVGKMYIQKSFLVHKHKSPYAATLLKNKIWVDRICWAKRNNIWWGEKEGWYRPRIFSWLSVAARTYLFISFVSTAVHLVWNSFSELTFKWGPHSFAIFTSLYLVFNWLSLTHRVRLHTNLQTQIVHLLPLSVGGRNVSISGGSTMVQKIWDLCFFFF